MPKPVLPKASDERLDALAVVSEHDVEEARAWVATVEQPPRRSRPRVSRLVEAEEPPADE